LQQEGEAPLLILWALTEELRAMAQVRSGLDRGQPLDGLLREARVWGPRQAPFRRAVQRMRSAQASTALEHAARIDRMIKGALRGDVWDEFRQLSLRLVAS
jgi:DNA polymerase-3 subunit delta